MMKARAPSKSLARAFTMVELMVVVALIAVVVTLAAPSFRDMILKQRLRGIHAQLATDLAFARSEAVSRAIFVGVRVQVVPGASGMSCYVINTRTGLGAPPCDCTANAGSRCTDPQTTEIRTVQIPADLATAVGVPSTQADNFTFDPRTGGMKLAPSDFGIYDASGFIIDAAIDSDAARRLRASVGVSGRISICTPAESQMGGVSCT